MNESLERFLERRRKKKQSGSTEAALSEHITQFFAGPEQKYAGAKIDIQVTVKGDVDLLQPLPTSSPVIKAEKVEPKTESENIKVDTNGGKEDKDVEIVPSTKKIVEIELSSSEEGKNDAGAITGDELLPDLKSVSLNTNYAVAHTKLGVHNDGKAKNKPREPFKFTAQQVKNKNDDDEDWIKVVSPQNFDVKSEEEEEIEGEERVVKSEEVTAVKSENVMPAKCKEVTQQETFHITYNEVDTTVKDEFQNLETVDVKSEEAIANTDVKTELDGISETPSEGNDIDYEMDVKFEVKAEDEVKSEVNDSDESNINEEVKFEVKPEVMAENPPGNVNSATDGNIIRSGTFVAPVTEDN